MAKKIKPAQRTAERELAFRSVFQLSFHDEADDMKSGIDAFLEDEAENKTEDSLKVNAGDFTRALIRAVVEQQETIDAILCTYIREGWSMERLPNVEKAALRLAAAEMLYLGTPKEIAINEAVNLVKTYADEDAHKYVNGILNHLANDHLKKEDHDEAGVSGD